MTYKSKKGKSRRILDAVRADILSGKLRPGDRIKSIRGLASDFAVSLKSAQCALDSLQREGLVQSKRGSGTFVKAWNGNEDDTIYFLVPNASYITSKHENSVVLRRLLYGATHSASPGQLVQLLPVCRSNNTSSLIRNPESIDWTTLERIPPGAKVFVSSAWYGPIIPYLIARGVRGVFLAKQYECEYPNTWRMVQDASWSLLTVDRRSAIRKVVEYLHSQGKRRIAALKRCEGQIDHPFRLGFMEGCEICQLDSSNEFFQEFESGQTEVEQRDIITNLWQKISFDALIVCDPQIVKGTLGVLNEQIEVSIPDEVALISYRDMTELVETNPPISAFDFSWVDIGREIINVFNHPGANPIDIRFQATIIERESTKKGSSNPVIQTSLPEISQEHEDLREVV